MLIKSLTEAIEVYKIKQIIDLNTKIGQELEIWFKASSYTINYYNNCAFIPILEYSK